MTKGKVYGDQADKLILSLMSEYRVIYNDAGKYGRSHEWILEQIGNRIHGHPDYKRLPDWGSHVLFYFSHHHMLKEWQRAHIYTHVIDGKRYVSGDPVFEGRYDELNASDESYHCYGFRVDDELVWVPINDANVEREIEAGRLSQEHLDKIRSAAHNQRTPRIVRVDGEVLVPAPIELVIKHYHAIINYPPS